MTLARELAALTVTVSTRTDDGLVHIAVALHHPDWWSFDEDEEIARYQWSFDVAVRLVTGELRRGWNEGSHDDATLIDNIPGATLAVPSSLLPSPHRVRIRGVLAFEGGPRIAWDQDLDEAAAALVLTDVAPTIDPIVPRAFAPTLRSIAVADAQARICACLPEVGLVTHSRTSGYALHTPGGTRALPELASLVDEVGGPETAIREYRGGPRGRLAIESERAHRKHLVIVELDDRDVRQLHASTEMWLTRGGFDARGALLVVATRRGTQVFDVDANKLLDVCGPPADLNGRWQVDRDELAGTANKQVHRISLGGDVSSARIPVDVGRSPSAWSSESGVAVWAGTLVPTYPQALHCVHPSWGVRTLALPPSGADSLAVLRDGRIVVAGDHLLLVDPARSEITDLGASGSYVGTLLQIIETDESTTLWTHDPTHWCVALPPGTLG